MSDSRPFELVLFGATGFTGRLTAMYLAGKGCDPPLRWAIAGRSREKLERVRAALAPRSAPSPPPAVRVASLDDPTSLRDLARDTRVLLTTVGPFARLGDPVVDACVAGGADYLDITGEPAFVAGVIARHHETAAARRLRIVPACGFDSIPHDLGAWLTVRALPPGQPIVVRNFVVFGGQVSGGTLTTALESLAAFGGGARRAGRGSAAARPTPDEGAAPRRRIRSLQTKVRYVPEIDAWVLPLPSVDPLIVKRTARFDPRYGPDFRYGHFLEVGSLPRLVGVGAALGAVAALAQTATTRRLLERLRPPGAGPDAEARRRAYFRATLLGETPGARAITVVQGGDPGYDETAKMVGEAALCLARDRDRLPERYGVLTPALAMEQLIVDRLAPIGPTFVTSGTIASGPDRL